MAGGDDEIQQKKQERLDKFVNPENMATTKAIKKAREHFCMKVLGKTWKGLVHDLKVFNNFGKKNQEKMKLANDRLMRENQNYARIMNSSMPPGRGLEEQFASVLEVAWIKIFDRNGKTYLTGVIADLLLVGTVPFRAAYHLAKEAIDFAKHHNDPKPVRDSSSLLLTLKDPLDPDPNASSYDALLTYEPAGPAGKDINVSIKPAGEKPLSVPDQAKFDALKTEFMKPGGVVHKALDSVLPTKHKKATINMKGDGTIQVKGAKDPVALVNDLLGEDMIGELNRADDAVVGHVLQDASAPSLPNPPPLPSP